MTTHAQSNARIDAPSAPSPGTIDWGVGSYERTASQLMPTARVVVDAAGIERRRRRRARSA